MVNAAVVGLGRWGQVLVNAARGSGKIRFVAGCTRTPAKAEAFAAEHGFRLLADYAAVLADPEVEAVVLATPHTQHADQVKAAAAAGKHVFCDKPFTLTRDSAAEAIAACRKAGVEIAVGHNRRFLPGYADLGLRRRPATSARCCRSRARSPARAPSPMRPRAGAPRRPRAPRAA